VAGFSLDGPLAELYPARVPVFPICSVGVGFNTNNETDCGAGYFVWYPVGRGTDGGGVDVGVDSAAGEED